MKEGISDGFELDKKIEVEADGWKSLTIEYTTRVFSGISWLYWRISGTEHIFHIQYQLIISNHAGSLTEHFQLVLKTFLEDYRQWEIEDFPLEWMRRYKEMYKSFIQ